MDLILLGHYMRGILPVEVVFLRNKRGGFRHRIWGSSLSIPYFEDASGGLYQLCWGVCLGREGRVLPRRIVQPWVGGCMQAKIGVWFRCQRFILAAWLCRVSRVSANNNIRVVGVLM